MASDQHFYFKYFPENNFVSKIFSKLCLGVNGLKLLLLLLLAQPEFSDSFNPFRPGDLLGRYRLDL